MTEATTLRRRDRLRAQTTEEIKSIALELLARDGPTAISLRAIAREMGMTAGAIYSYYETRDALVSALIADVYAALAQIMETACHSAPADDPPGRIMAVAMAYRQWAITHPDEFRLIYGDAIPGYQTPEGGAAAEAEHRACAVLLELVRGAWSSAAATQADHDIEWSDFNQGFLGVIRSVFPELPPAAMALAFRLWGRMHGPVALEVYGHLAPQITDTAKIYRVEMLDFIRSLGLVAR